MIGMWLSFILFMCMVIKSQQESSYSLPNAGTIALISQNLYFQWSLTKQMVKDVEGAINEVSKFKLRFFKFWIFSPFFNYFSFSFSFLFFYFIFMDRVYYHKHYWSTCTPSDQTCEIKRHSCSGIQLWWRLFQRIGVLQSDLRARTMAAEQFLKGGFHKPLATDARLDAISKLINNHPIPYACPTKWQYWIYRRKNSRPVLIWWLWLYCFSWWVGKIYMLWIIQTSLGKPTNQLISLLGFFWPSYQRCTWNRRVTASTTL